MLLDLEWWLLIYFIQKNKNKNKKQVERKRSVGYYRESKSQIKFRYQIKYEEIFTRFFLVEENINLQDIKSFFIDKYQ